MKMGVIRGDLIKQLASDDLQDVKRVLTFLIERVRYDMLDPHTDQKAIPALLEHVFTQNRDHANLRIITFLLMLPKPVVLWELEQVLLKNPQPQNWLTPAFLLLGMEGEETKTLLLKLERSSRNSHKLHAEMISTLSMLDAHPKVAKLG